MLDECCEKVDLIRTVLILQKRGIFDYSQFLKLISGIVNNEIKSLKEYK